MFVRLKPDAAGKAAKTDFLVLPVGTPAAALACKYPYPAAPFGLAPEAVPLAYGDDYPPFAVPSGQLANPPAGVATYPGRQLRYPATDLRARRKGTVYAYLEVSATGAIEHRQLAGSPSPILNAEVPRVGQRLPPALSPPRQQGCPARVS